MTQGVYFLSQLGQFILHLEDVVAIEVVIVVDVRLFWVETLLEMVRLARLLLIHALVFSKPEIQLFILVPQHIVLVLLELRLLALNHQLLFQMQVFAFSHHAREHSLLLLSELNV